MVPTDVRGSPTRSGSQTTEVYNTHVKSLGKRRRNRCNGSVPSSPVASPKMFSFDTRIQSSSWAVLPVSLPHLGVLGGDLLEVVHGGADVVRPHEERVVLLQREEAGGGASVGGVSGVKPTDRGEINMSNMSADR